jgi:hypothetical protein
MGEATRTEAKASEAKKQKVASQKQKTDLSQSICSPAEQIMFLQRTIANQAVGRLIKSWAFQAKLRIGQPWDVYEQEAGRVAKQVMRIPEPQKVSNNSISTLTSLENKGIQRYTVPGSLPCGDVVDWLNNNSPYAPEWAQTHRTYSFIGNLRMTGNRNDSGYEIRVKGHRGLSVSVNCPIDRPSWAAMKTIINAHVHVYNILKIFSVNKERAVGQWNSS